jgi:cytochrome c peroxidase
MVLLGGLLLAQVAVAHGPKILPLQDIPVPPVPGLLDGSSPIVVDQAMAIALGKALFWDMNVGSDGQACGSCHFHAGADSRVKNQLNPGIKSSQPSGQTFDVLGSGSGGPNHTMALADFPLHKFANVMDNTSAVLRTTDDVVSSAGTFAGTFQGVTQFNGGNDICDRSADPIHHVGGVGTRFAEPRNTPTVINAIFNYRNFWDGRANNVFNGSTPWGDRDPNAGVWVKIGPRSVAKQRLHLENAALASLAMGPPLSSLEMSCAGRNLAMIGRKLLLRKPLQTQKVHYQDSVFAPLALTTSTASANQPGLNTTYKAMITKAFNPKYWSYSALGPFGTPAPGQTPYNQVEANFSLFFGIALQMYEATLISDQAPIDLTPRDSGMMATWEGMGKTPAEIASLKNGQIIFEGNHCLICHSGPLATAAAISSYAAVLTPTPGKFYGPAHFRIPFGADAFGIDTFAGNGGSAKFAGLSRFGNVVDRPKTVAGYKLNDLGFANTGVANPQSDPGVGGTDDFGNPLSFSTQYLQYLLGNSAAMIDQPLDKQRGCDFQYPLARNINYGFSFGDVFTAVEGVQADGSREGVTLAQECSDPAAAYIPTVAAANAALVNNPAMLASTTKAAFKIPSLRNVELTGPYMHNGSMATLEQVVEFYARHGNFPNPDMNEFLVQTQLNKPTQDQDRADLVAFLKTLTDERVKYERAPFDHPEITIANGHVGDEYLVTPGNPLSPALAKEETLLVPAVGANGKAAPLTPFVDQLQ